MPTYVRIVGILFLVAFMLSLGLETRKADLVEVLRRPRFLLRAWIVAIVLIPFASALSSLALGLSRPLTVAVILLAVAPAAPFVALAVRAARGSVPFATALNITLAGVTVITAPLFWRYFLSRGVDADIDTVQLILRLAGFQILPLAVGLAVRERAPNAAPSINRLARSVYLTTMPVLLVLVITPHLSSLVSLGWRGLGVTLFASLVAWLIAWFGGHDAVSRRTVMIVCGAPNIGLSIAILQAAGAPAIFASTIAGMWIVRIALNLTLAKLIGSADKRSPHARRLATSGTTTADRAVPSR